MEIETNDAIKYGVRSSYSVGDGEGGCPRVFIISWAKGLAGPNGRQKTGCEGVMVRPDEEGL